MNFTSIWVYRNWLVDLTLIIGSFSVDSGHGDDLSSSCESGAMEIQVGTSWGGLSFVDVTSSGLLRLCNYMYLCDIPIHVSCDIIRVHHSSLPPIKALLCTAGWPNSMGHDEACAHSNVIHTLQQPSVNRPHCVQSIAVVTQTMKRCLKTHGGE